MFIRQFVLEQVWHEHRIDCACTQLGFEVVTNINCGDAIFYGEYSLAVAIIHIAGVRSAAADASQAVLFVFRHAPLSTSYCYSRLQNYGERCGVVLTPHQLRHSCTTLLLNAGAPVVSIQTILGHKWIDTTLGYAQLYNGTLATDYYRAMNEVEKQLELVERPPQDAPNLGELVALVDSLRSGTLNENQTSAVQSLRDGLLALARQEQQEYRMEDVKELVLAE